MNTRRSTLWLEPEDSLPPVGIEDVDLLASVREGGSAALADAAVVDAPAFDPRGERPEVLGSRALQGRPCYPGRLPIAISPPLPELVISVTQPFPEGREAFKIPPQFTRSSS